jgi:hypothetical protein
VSLGTESNPFVYSAFPEPVICFSKDLLIFACIVLLMKTLNSGAG